LNLGIVAHVDAGKTSLTERLLFAAGVIDEIGSVDQGNTQTDSLALERERGITIKSAVVSFVLGDITVNLIDTPGHPDFIAEVERVLNVLDGAVLVISAVEGVQPQTRILMRALQRLRIPTLIFVNKIDRRGARDAGVVDEIAAKLTPEILPMGSTRHLGSPQAEFVAFGAGDRDLARQTRRSAAHPVFFGSAITGAGLDELSAGIAELLPARQPDAASEPSGVVFKIERASSRERIAFVRMFSGAVNIRDRLDIRGEPRKVTAIRVFDRGAVVPRPTLAAGHIGKLWGLGDVRIGDTIGTIARRNDAHRFAPPTLETVIVARDPDDKGALRVALDQLAEQDPLINVRQDDVRQETYVSLYGEVQKEVIQQTLAADFGVEVEFRETTMIYVERPVGTGHAIDLLGRNPFLATVGLRVEPAPIGTGIEVVLGVEPRAIPLYVFGTVEEFHGSIREFIENTLQQGLCGRRVTDCKVTMTDSDYSAPGTKAPAFRKLIPLVLMRALRQAGTVVCEPMHRIHLEAPAESLGSLLSALAGVDGVPEATEVHHPSCVIEGLVPAARLHELRTQLSPLTHGEGVLEAEFDSYRPVRGTPPTRPRTDLNPLNRKEYLLHVLRRV
jgi:ribosomal protection tetracycline resistance protein